MLKAPPLVVTLASDRLAMFEFGIAAEFFALARPELDFVPYRFAVAAADPLPLRGLGGIRVDVDGGLDLLRDANLIVVPGWRDLDETPRPEITTALRDAVEHGARVASICSGAFLLAHAGLLDGRRATTHWRHTERLARLFPKIRVEPDVLYIDEGNVMTSAGSAAGIDLLLHLVRKDYGPHIANTFARRMVVPPHRDGGQSQFVVQPIAVRTNDRIATVADWMAGNLRDAVERGARVASICSGAFLLGHAGLLDARRATTHWRHAERLARLFPAARVEPDVLYVDEGQVMTSAGSAAGIDLMLHLVRKDYGPHVANVELTPIGEQKRDPNQVLVGDGWVVVRHPDLQFTLEMTEAFANELRLVAG